MSDKFVLTVSEDMMRRSASISRQGNIRGNGYPIAVPVAGKILKRCANILQDMPSPDHDCAVPYINECLTEALTLLWHCGFLTDLRLVEDRESVEFLDNEGDSTACGDPDVCSLVIPDLQDSFGCDVLQDLTEGGVLGIKVAERVMNDEVGHDDSSTSDGQPDTAVASSVEAVERDGSETPCRPADTAPSKKEVLR